MEDASISGYISLKLQPVGFAPILQCYFERCGIAKIIDDNIIDPRRKILTHGQASVTMITGILFQVLPLYRICKFAKETTSTGCNFTRYRFK